MTRFTALIGFLLCMGCQKTLVHHNLSSTNERMLSPSEISVAQYAVYGEDNRKEYFEETSPERKAVANSVAAVVASDSLTVYPNGAARITGRELRHSSMRVCEAVPYSHQIKGAYGTAVLISEDLMLTAGHVTPGGECPDSFFIFGFKKSKRLSDGTYVKSSDAYTCKKVEYFDYTQSNKDLAVIRLDRPVKGFRPVPISFKGVKRNDPLWMAGYPSGVPLKITDKAQVLAQNRFFFRANLDAFGGNSGSPVLNSQNEIVGILVRGEGDYQTIWSNEEKRNCAIPTTIHLGEKECEPTLFNPSSDPLGGFDPVASKCFGEQISQIKVLENVLNSIR